MSIWSLLFSTEVDLWTASIRDLLSVSRDILTELGGRHNNSSSLSRRRMHVSAASTASRHSADKDEFTTRLILLLCQLTSAYVPLSSIMNTRNPPWEPRSGRFAKLASQKHTRRTVFRSILLGKVSDTLCPRIFLTTLLAWCTSAMVALEIRPPNTQLSNETSGLL